MTKGQARPGPGDRGSLAGFVAITVVILAILIWSTMQISGWFTGYDPEFADIKNDWVVATALLDGENPYGDLHHLSAEYAGDSYAPPGDPGSEVEPTRTPRTPGAIVLAVPFSFFEISKVTQWNNLLAVWLVIPIVAMVVWKRSEPIWMMAAIALAWSAPMLWNLKFSNVSAIVAVLMALFVAIDVERDSGWAGLPVALATTMKVFPGILLVYFGVRKQWRNLSIGTALLALLNLGPAMLPTENNSSNVD